MRSDALRQHSPLEEFLAGTAHALRIVRVATEPARDRMHREVVEGLTQPQGRSVPPTYFYDDRGSRLYEGITALAEYYPARTEARILQTAGPALAERLAPACLVELGSGSSSKTRALLEAFGARERPLTYVPIDVSAGMLEASARRLMKDFAGVRILGLAGRYEDALAALPSGPERLVVFLGGTLGNFPLTAQATFFDALARWIEPGGHLLVGFDRRPHAGKSAAVIQAAYDDAKGLTARFNLNLLSHLNRELGADFEPARWRHRAHYNEREHQIEMYLESLNAQTVRLRSGERFHFEASETILTELSRKFDPDEFARWTAARGFQERARFEDERAYFTVALFERA